tara:strand:+ start:288 stop:506 length:219 start_codon:yes stop_codon:yes gene_type:complete
MSRNESENMTEVLMRILDVIDQCKRRIKIIEESSKSWDSFPELNLAAKNRIDTLQRVLKRLNFRYNKTLIKL